MTNKISSQIVFAKTKVSILVFLLTASQVTLAQEPPVPTVQNQTEIQKEFYELIEVDVKPDFPGG